MDFQLPPSLLFSRKKKSCGKRDKKFANSQQLSALRNSLVSKAWTVSKFSTPSFNVDNEWYSLKTCHSKHLFITPTWHASLFKKKNTGKTKRNFIPVSRAVKDHGVGKHNSVLTFGTRWTPYVRFIFLQPYINPFVTSGTYTGSDRKTWRFLS